MNREGAASIRTPGEALKRRYFWLLLFLLLLFCLRVLGQVLVAFFGVTFLPPMEEWFSGVLPYPELLACQILIIFLYGKVCLDFFRGHGYFVIPRARLGINLLRFGSLYLGVMLIRYAIRMGLYPHERWMGGSIPIFFHWVLASFLLVLGSYHWRAATRARTPGIGAQILPWTLATVVGLGIVVWIAYQIAPSVLAHQLGFRRSQFAVRVTSHAAVVTSDGTSLLADIYHPQHTSRTPTILIRIPLTRTLENSLFASVIGRMWAERGYTVMIQGTRGRFGSGGTFYPLHNERQDGIETLAWIGKQPWCDGHILTWGGSAFGYTQWAIADQADPGLSALIVYFASTDFHGMFYPGGAFSLYSALSWAWRSHGYKDQTDWPSAADVHRASNGFPLEDADRRAIGADVPFFRDWVNHPNRDSYWAEIDGTGRTQSLSAPILLIAGWYDPFLPTQLNDFVEMRRSASSDVAAQSHLIIGPWTHASEVTFPDGTKAENFRRKSLAVSLPWFDQHSGLTGSRSTMDAPVKIFVMGKNEWRTEQEWPLTRTDYTPYFLSSGGAANGIAGNGILTPDASVVDEPSDAYDYDPRNPVPTAGGAMIGAAAGIARQNEIEVRRDVLVYTTSALQQDVEVTGPISLVLYVSTTARSTDFTAKLVDVHTDGSAYNISEGILRCHYDDPGSTARPTRTHEIRVDLWPTSMMFFKGHRIRLEVSSSNFPRFDRNPNTGSAIATETHPVVANQKVLHGLHYPSRLILPIVPTS